MFQTSYDNYNFLHYLGFILLGLCGGLVGGLFCRSNLKWFKTFQQMAAIQKSPTFEVFLVAMITAVLQFPNPLLRETGDKVMQRLLVDCSSAPEDWICQQEAKTTGKGAYYGWLILATFSKLFLTTITFGTKVPSGIIMPAMDSGALFGRLVGQFMPGVSPGVLALVGSAAFLAGMSRMTVSLAVTMFELTGEVTFIPPFMVAILIAKRVADYIHADGAYELARRIQGHPFLDADNAVAKVKKLRETEGSATVSQLLPAPSTLEDVTLRMGSNHQVATAIVREKLGKLQARGLMDAGLVVVNAQGICHGYIPQAALESALDNAGLREGAVGMSLLDDSLFGTVDRNPLTVLADAPLEYAVEIFSKLGVSYLVVVQEETAKVVGVVLKKQLLGFLDD
jgi:chloride channel 3/4/5